MYVYKLVYSPVIPRPDWTGFCISCFLFIPRPDWTGFCISCFLFIPRPDWTGFFLSVYNSVYSPVVARPKDGFFVLYGL